MALYGKLFQVTFTGVMFAMLAAAAAAQAKPGCLNICGDVEIPFPFGLTGDCSLNPTFLVTCVDSSKPKWNDYFNVTSISIDAHQLEAQHFVASDCYDRFGAKLPPPPYNKPWLHTGGVFTLSKTRNKFTALGCDTYANITGLRNGENYTSGCVSVCNSLHNVVNGSCSGIGCCELEIPDGVTGIEMVVGSYQNHTKIWNFNPCGYAFVVKQGKFKFSSDYLSNLPFEVLPMVLDWAVANDTCEEGRQKSNFACQGNYSECFDLDTRPGYRCKCRQGYQGNPYLPDGCQDIDECKDPTLSKCTRAENCLNTPGNYTCHCPKWSNGDGRKDGEGCVADPSPVIKIAIGVGIGFIVTFVSSSRLQHFAQRRRRDNKLKKKNFQLNGGSILKEHLMSQGGSQETIKIFTAKELIDATNNYHESRILDQGDCGIVYEGHLPDKRIVAIKKSKRVAKNRVKQFINMLVGLSNINHKHVVKLLGCCLEEEVPLLVYEYVPKGTLLKYIHQRSNKSTFTWETRLRIAAETAEALSYLHSTASPTIIHRDVKSSNILLDDNLTAKVSDFETACLVLQDEECLATSGLNGTLGYLDPEYLQTHELTENSDVYSFGVLLVELLTGKEVFSFKRSPKEERSLAMHFLSSLKSHPWIEVVEECIIEEGNKKQIEEVVEITKRCLKVKGKQRPKMKDVAIELDLKRKKENEHKNWVSSSDIVGQVADVTLIRKNLKIADRDDDSSTIGPQEDPMVAEQDTDSAATIANVEEEDEEHKNQIEEVMDITKRCLGITKRCLKVKGKQRPKMKDVAIELDLKRKKENEHKNWASSSDTIGQVADVSLIRKNLKITDRDDDSSTVGSQEDPMVVEQDADSAATTTNVEEEDEENKKQIKEVVEITKRCSKVKGKQRPKMKDVAIELNLKRKKENEHKNWVSSSDTVGQVADDSLIRKNLKIADKDDDSSTFGPQKDPMVAEQHADSAATTANVEEDDAEEGADLDTDDDV